MTWWEAVLLVGGGTLTGMINAVAGGGSMLTVPLLVLAGVPGNSANGSNRVGILSSNLASATSIRIGSKLSLATIWPPSKCNSLAKTSGTEARISLTSN